MGNNQENYKFVSGNSNVKFKRIAEFSSFVSFYTLGEPILVQSPTHFQPKEMGLGFPPSFASLYNS